MHEFDGLDGHPLHGAVVAEMERLTVYADAQEIKVGQLQSALDSRVVIEQAIGMLAERFNIPFKDVLELLEAGARNTRQQMSDRGSAKGVAADASRDQGSTSKRCGPSPEQPDT